MPLAMSEEIADKSLLRTHARQTRDRVHGAIGLFATTAITRVFFEHVAPDKNTVIAGYWPTRNELDIRILMSTLADKGYQTALPRITKKAEPLSFHPWRTGEDLQAGRYNILEPANNSDVIIPDIVLVPVLAFDHEGNRLGYGGGYYDRTLAALRTEQKPITALGVAYSQQRLKSLPTFPHDEPINGILTETYARFF